MATRKSQDGEKQKAWQRFEASMSNLRKLRRELATKADHEYAAKKIGEIEKNIVLASVKFKLASSGKISVPGDILKVGEKEVDEFEAQTKSLLHNFPKKHGGEAPGIILKTGLEELNIKAREALGELEKAVE